jgi:hypothetical protein
MFDEPEVEIKYYLTVTVNDETVYEGESSSEEDFTGNDLRKAEHAIEAKKQELSDAEEADEQS